MKKFDFRLQGILRLRSFKEEKLKTEMGEIVGNMNRVRENIIKLNNEIDEAYDTQRKHINEEIGGQILQFFGYYVDGKRNDIVANKEKLEELKVQYKEKQKELFLAMGDVKVIEGIKDKQLEKYKKEYNKKEQEDVEELLRMREELG